jgi:hypothetical protein
MRYLFQELSLKLSKDDHTKNNAYLPDTNSSKKILITGITNQSVCIIIWIFKHMKIKYSKYSALYILTNTSQI